MPQEDGRTLCVWCLGVQHATLALGDETLCDICRSFQPQVIRNRLARAMGAEALLPVAEPSAALGAPVPTLLLLSQSLSQDIPCAQVWLSTPLSCSPSLQEKRVKRSRQTRDIMDLKTQMAQVLELLSRQQAPAAPAAAPAPPLPAPLPAQGEGELPTLMAEEDALSITSA
ncbi:UNVERIFIED_CONTAM: hypothetical protein FKN15_064630 [Acipenser sinensis]